jgi:uncharacterized protein YcbK (DUF882 family)
MVHRQTKAAVGFAQKLISRRRMLRYGAVTMASVATGSWMSGVATAADWIRVPSAASVRYLPPHPLSDFQLYHSNRKDARSLAFHNAHTGENLKTIYWEGGAYVPEALGEINYFFRDFRAHEVRSIDPRLLDLLYKIHSGMGSSQPFLLISGYRTAATNAWLASLSGGGARHSLHTEGRAADINLPGCELIALRNAALAMRGGGVGYYPRSDFVHVDTGRVRHWRYG